jgi:hypothetical protein
MHNKGKVSSMKLTLTTVEYSTLGSSNPGADTCRGLQS